MYCFLLSERLSLSAPGQLYFGCDSDTAQESAQAWETKTCSNSSLRTRAEHKHLSSPFSSSLPSSVCARERGGDRAHIIYHLCSRPKMSLLWGDFEPCQPCPKLLTVTVYFFFPKCHWFSSLNICSSSLTQRRNAVCREQTLKPSSRRALEGRWGPAKGLGLIKPSQTRLEQQSN